MMSCEIKKSKSVAFGEVGICRMLPLLLLLIVGTGLFCSVADARSAARSAKSQLENSMKTQFDAAITNGDVDAARVIWESIDTKFSSKLDRGIARAVIYGGSAVSRQSQLQNLALNSAVKLEQIALFLSSIDLSRFVGGPPPTVATGQLSGTVRGGRNERLAGAKVIVAGQQTVTDGRGSYTFAALPTGTYDMFVLAAGQKLGLAFQTIAAKKSSSLSFGLTALDAPPPPTPEEARAQIDAILMDMGKALTSTKAEGQEILAGTLLDAGTGAPIAGAEVSLVCEGNEVFKTLIAEAKSNPQGHFEITRIPEGVCDLTAAYTNATFANLAEKMGSGEAYYYVLVEKLKIIANATHRHKRTWKLEAKAPSTD